MPTIQLGYGRGGINFDYDATRFDVLAANDAPSHPLSDVEIGAALDAPIDSPPLEALITPGDSVLIVASDATRATGSAQVINLLVRRLIQNGTAPGDIAIIFATGIHRAVRPDEKAELLTPFIAQRIRTIDHDAYDASQLTQLGVMDDGTPIEVNRALKEFAKVILTGAVGFHYFAGFTGGRKAICPGLASAETIKATHMLALDFERGGRRAVRHGATLQHNGRARHFQSDFGVLLDQKDGDLAVGEQQPHGGDQFIDNDRRQAFERFVQQQQRRIGHQRARRCQHLLLAARDLVAHVAAALGQPREQLEYGGEIPGARPRSDG